jgi:hypothetical protein
VKKNGNQKLFNTEKIIKIYLDNNYRPLGALTWDDLEMEFADIISLCDHNQISHFIKKMNYYIFLKTPYWKLISAEIRRKFKFRCVMCDSNKNLRVHHKNYEFHGFEHTKNGFNSLTCVCNDCHSKHHGHYEQKHI